MYWLTCEKKCLRFSLLTPRIKTFVCYCRSYHALSQETRGAWGTRIKRLVSTSEKSNVFTRCLHRNVTIKERFYTNDFATESTSSVSNVSTRLEKRRRLPWLSDIFFQALVTRLTRVKTLRRKLDFSQAIWWNLWPFRRQSKNARNGKSSFQSDPFLKCFERFHNSSIFQISNQFPTTLHFLNTFSTFHHFGFSNCPKKSIRHDLQVHITRAANPSDILWENLSARGPSRRRSSTETHQSDGFWDHLDKKMDDFKMQHLWRLSKDLRHGKFLAFFFFFPITLFRFENV